VENRYSGILPGEGYIGIRALADFSVCVQNTQQGAEQQLALDEIIFDKPSSVSSTSTWETL